MRWETAIPIVMLAGAVMLAAYWWVMALDRGK